MWGSWAMEETEAATLLLPLGLRRPTECLSARTFPKNLSGTYWDSFQIPAHSVRPTHGRSSGSVHRLGSLLPSLLRDPFSLWPLPKSGPDTGGRSQVVFLSDRRSSHH